MLARPFPYSADTPMKATIERINLTYEVAFAAPLFDLPIRGTDLLSSLHGAIHPRYSIPLTHMQIFGGNAMSDVRVRITLFNGSGIIDVTSDKLSIMFTDILGQDGIEISKDCIATTERIVRSFFSEHRVAYVSVNPTMFILLDSTEMKSGIYLSEIMSSEIEFDLEEFDEAIQYPGINLTVESSEAGWSAIFHAYQNSSTASSLVISCHAQYVEGGQISNLEERSNHLSRLFGKFIDGLGLEIQDSSSKIGFGER